MGFMRVPLLDTCRQNEPVEAEFLEAFRRVLASGQFILGPEVERFEAATAAAAGARFAIGMSSGTDAILAALMAFGIGPGDEVICPSFTFFATAGSVARVGAKPVFADSCPTRLTSIPPASSRSSHRAPGPSSPCTCSDRRRIWIPSWKLRAGTAWR